MGGYFSFAYFSAIVRLCCIQVSDDARFCDMESRSIGNNFKMYASNFFQKEFLVVAYIKMYAYKGLISFFTSKFVRIIFPVSTAILNAIVIRKIRKM